MRTTQIDIMTPCIQENPMWCPILCRIHTDEGIYGDGEAALAYDIASPAAAGIIRDLATFIIGMDPLDSEAIWDKLYESIFWGQNGDSVIFADVFALDVTLWDIKGEVFNMPVYKLLSGKRRDDLHTYAGQLQFGWNDHAETLTTLDEYREVSKKAVAGGYDAVKVDFFTYTPEDGRRYTDEDCARLLSPKLVDIVESHAATVHKAIGPNVDIIMESHSRPDTQSAVQLGRVVQRYNIFYFEEPNTPSPKTTKFISNKLSIPITHGGRVYPHQQYAPFFGDQSIQVIQPDLGNCDGLTEGRKICDMVYVYDINVQTHVCANPLFTAIALYLESVIPNFVIHKYYTNNLKPQNKELCTVDWWPVDSKFKVPEGSGSGCESMDKVLNTENEIIAK